MDAVFKSFSWRLWELAAEPLELTVVERSDGAPPAIQSLRVSRDEDYRLLVTFEGQGKTPEDLFPKDRQNRGRGWEVVQPFTIKAARGAAGAAEFVLTNCFVVDSKISATPTTDEIRAQGTLSVWSMSLHDEREDPADVLVDWYLNGPTDWFYWPDHTDYKGSQGLTISRFVSGKKEDKADTSVLQAPWSGSVDCMILHGLSFRAILHGVPKAVAPEWATPIGIEYRSEWGIPDEAKRRSIANALSFALGTGLLHVGRSEFKEDRRLRAVSFDLRVGPARELCSEIQYAPFDYALTYSKAPVKDWVARVVDQYLVLDSKLDLEASLRYYWLASRPPAGYNFPLLAAAMEGLVARWAEENGDAKIKNVIDPEIFRVSVAPEVKRLVSQLPVDDPKKKAIQEHMLNANRWSGNQTWKLTLAALGVQPTPEEQEALSKRNVFAHGREADELLKSGRVQEMDRALRSLYMRLVLAIIGHVGWFMDHSPAEPRNCWMDARTLPAEIKGIAAGEK